MHKKSRCNVVLIRPPVEVQHKFSKPVENLAVGYLGAAVRKAGNDAVLLDGMLHDWSDQRTAYEILAAHPDIVAFTTVLQCYPENLTTIFRLLREGGFGGPIVLGGHAVSFMGRRILEMVPELDIVVSGEGEAAIAALAGCVARGEDWSRIPGISRRESDGTIRSNTPRRMTDLDAVGNPVRDLTKQVIDRDGLVAVSTSRGCYARCSFCSVPRFYGLDKGKHLASGSWLARNPIAAAGEIADLFDRFALRELLIVDDEFFGGTQDGLERALTFARTLQNIELPTKFAMSCRAENVNEKVLENLQKGGLTHVFIGIESGSDIDLKLYGKGHRARQNWQAIRTVKALGMSFQAGFMLFNYRSTLEQIAESIRFLAKVGELKPIALNSAMEPHFGTPIVTDISRKKALLDNVLSLGQRFLDPAVATLKAIAEACAASFVTDMNFIATVRSSVTFEWRRAVPGRAMETEAMLDTFETNVNAAYTGIVEEALSKLQNLRSRGLELDKTAIADLLEWVRDHIATVEGQTALQRALVSSYLLNTEGKVQYYCQKDLIAQANPLTAR